MYHYKPRNWLFFLLLWLFTTNCFWTICGAVFWRCKWIARLYLRDRQTDRQRNPLPFPVHSSNSHSSSCTASHHWGTQHRTDPHSHLLPPLQWAGPAGWPLAGPGLEAWTAWGQPGQLSLALTAQAVGLSLLAVLSLLLRAAAPDAGVKRKTGLSVGALFRKGGRAVKMGPWATWNSCEAIYHADWRVHAGCARTEHTSGKTLFPPFFYIKKWRPTNTIWHWRKEKKSIKRGEFLFVKNANFGSIRPRTTKIKKASLAV